MPRDANLPPKTTGCRGPQALIGLLALMFVSLAVLENTDASEGVGVGVFCLLLLPAAVWCIIYAFRLAAQNEAKLVQLKVEASDYVRHIDGFAASQLFITATGKAFIAFDEVRNRLAIGGRTDSTLVHRIVDVENILAVNLSDNGHEVASAGSALASAALGGVLFGGLGAVAGAVMGAGARSASELSLRLRVDDLQGPSVGINFLERQIPKAGPDYQRLKGEAEKWFALVQVLLDRQARRTHR